MPSWGCLPYRIGQHQPTTALQIPVGKSLNTLFDGVMQAPNRAALKTMPAIKAYDEFYKRFKRDLPPLLQLEVDPGGKAVGFRGCVEHSNAHGRVGGFVPDSHLERVSSQDSEGQGMNA